jgi:hypothetical protein
MDDEPSTSVDPLKSDPEFTLPPRRVKKSTHVPLNAPRDILSSKKIQEESVRCGLSLVQTVAMVSAFILACNGNMNEFVLSVSTEKRRKSSMITSVAGDLQRNYKLPESPVLRWDEKKTDGKERCSVVFDGDQAPPMHIGSPVLPSGHAEKKFEAIKGLCGEWGMKKEIKESIPVCLGFDTTATNSGE